MMTNNITQPTRGDIIMILNHHKEGTSSLLLSKSTRHRRMRMINNILNSTVTAIANFIVALSFQPEEDHSEAQLYFIHC